MSNSCFEVAMGVSYDMYHHQLSDQKLAQDALKDSVYAYSYDAKPGFHLGFLKSFELNNNLLLRTGVTGSYSQVNYRFLSDNKDNFQHHLDIKSQVLSFTVPVHAIYYVKLSKKRNSSYPYLLAGGFYSYQTQTGFTHLMGHNSGTSIVLNGDQAGVDAGIGCRLFVRRKYICSPELKCRVGLMNMKGPYNDPYNKFFDVLKMQSIILAFHFS